MPGRLVPLINGHFYHVINRGSDNRDIYLKSRNYKRFIQTLYYYQFAGPKPKFSRFAKADLVTLKPTLEKKIVEIICFCLMPNHFHLLIRQQKTNGISIFMSQLANSYTKFFNTKYPRIGPLLQGSFKAVLVENDEQLMHLSRYIHLNPIVAGLTNDLLDWHWSSFREYILGSGNICSKDEVLSFFKSPSDYKEFVSSRVDYGISLEMLKRHLLDEA